MTCASLASGPLDRASGLPGPRVDEIVPGAAVKACEEAVQREPNSAANWHYLARAYSAGMALEVLDADVYGLKAMDAMRKAASLGEPLDAMRIASFGNWQNKHIDQNVPGLQQAIASVQGKAGSSPSHALALATGRGVLLSITERVDGRAVLRGTHDPEMQGAISSAAAKIGWKAVYDHYFELMVGGDCFYKAMCIDYFDAIKGSGDARVFLALGVDNMAYAYRNTNRAFASAGSSEAKRQAALRAGDRSIDSVRQFARLAAEHGNAEQKAAANDLLKGAQAFDDYVVAQYGTEGEQAARAQAEGWKTVAVLIAAAIALSGDGEGAPASDYQTESISWAEQQRRADCNLAQGMATFRNTMSADERNGYAAMEMASCY